jgi:hypothetical protein
MTVPDQASGELAVPEPDGAPGLFSAGDSWDALTSGADEIFGGELEKAESLIGVPFVAVRVTFRVGDFTRADTNEPGDYVSIDLITAPEDIIAKRRAKGRIPDTVNIEASSHLVFNVSGTAAYRQIVSYLEVRKLIVLPEGPENGEFGKSRMDTPVRLWNIHKSARVRLDEDGKYESAEFDIRLHAPRGLRISEFDNRHGKDISVYYLG